MSRSGLPRVVIDGRMVGEGFDPVANSVRMIAKGLAELPRLDYEPVFLCAPGMAAAFSGFEAIEQRTVYLDPREVATLPVQLWKLRAKLYHSPSISSLASAPCLWVVSLPDLRYLAYGKPFERVYLEALVKPFIARAAKVITPTESMTHEVAEWSKKARCEVVPLPIDPAVLKQNEGAPPFLEPDRYFFTPAGTDSRENLRTLLEAFSRFWTLKEGNKIYRLAILRKDGVDDGPSEISGIVPIASLRGEVQAALLGARAIFLPSVYEGASQVAVESVALGKRLVLSDIPAHRSELRFIPSNEIRWVRPLSIQDWTNAFAAAAEGGGLHAVSGKVAQETRSGRSVRTFGERLDSIYRSVLGI